MMDSKIFLLTVLLLSQISHADAQKEKTDNVDRKLVETVISEDELLLLIKNKVLIENEDGTLSLDKKALKEVKKNGFNLEHAAAGSICAGSL
jgi:hypothetical protein